MFTPGTYSGVFWLTSIQKINFALFLKGFRTRSHYVAEPAEKFVSIDMYKRPLTNQPGKIIFDHGRPNNGYYLQRNQCI